MTYESRNQVDPKPLKLAAINGLAIDEGGSSIHKACIGLFSETEHRLIASAETSEDGKFLFDKIPHGRYRLVAKHPLLCTANVPLVIGSRPFRSKKQLVLHMKVSGIDTCSYGDMARGHSPAGAIKRCAP